MGSPTVHNHVYLFYLGVGRGVDLLGRWGAIGFHGSGLIFGSRSGFTAQGGGTGQKYILSKTQLPRKIYAIAGDRR